MPAQCGNGRAGHRLEMPCDETIQLNIWKKRNRSNNTRKNKWIKGLYSSHRSWCCLKTFLFFCLSIITWTNQIALNEWVKYFEWHYITTNHPILHWLLPKITSLTQTNNNLQEISTALALLTCQLSYEGTTYLSG